MDFGDAIKAVKNGERVKRAGWGGYWFLPVVIKVSDHTPRLPNDGFMNNTIVACLKDAEGITPATPCMADMLADDWEIATVKNGKLIN